MKPSSLLVLTIFLTILGVTPLTAWSNTIEFKCYVQDLRKSEVTYSKSLTIKLNGEDQKHKLTHRFMLGELGYLSLEGEGSLINLENKIHITRVSTLFKIQFLNLEVANMDMKKSQNDNNLMARLSSDISLGKFDYSYGCYFERNEEAQREHNL